MSRSSSSVQSFNKKIMSDQLVIFPFNRLVSGLRLLEILKKPCISVVCLFSIICFNGVTKNILDFIVQCQRLTSNM